jgi:hypothetical protein
VTGADRWALCLEIDLESGVRVDFREERESRV